MLGTLGIVTLLTVTYVAAVWRSGPLRVPSFQRITYQKGAIWRARFAPDGQTVVYAMQGVGDDKRPAELYSTRVGGLDSRSLGLAAGTFLSRVLVRWQSCKLRPTVCSDSVSGHSQRRRLPEGRLVRSSKMLPGRDGVSGRPRTRRRSGQWWEAPPRVSDRKASFYDSTDSIIGEPRVSPDGEMLAFRERKSDRVALRVANRKGAIRTLLEAGGKNVESSPSRGEELLVDQVGRRHG